MMSNPPYRCFECAEYHMGDCDQKAQIAFRIECVMDGLDELLGLPPEPGGRRWLIAKGEYPEDVFPSGIKDKFT